MAARGRRRYDPFVEREAVEGRIRLERPRCPFCHDDVDRGEDVAVCRDCDAKHHADCWPVGGRCGACGGLTALRALDPAPTTGAGDDARDEAAAHARTESELSVARWHFAETVAVLRRRRARRYAYPWWMLLVPLCWPLAYLRHRDERARVRELVDHARRLARRHSLEVSAEDEALLREASVWAY